MFKALILILSLSPLAAVAADFTPTPSRPFSVTPLPARLPNRFNESATTSVIGSCALNDCTEVRISQPSVLPSALPGEGEPAAGEKESFCQNVNISQNPELCDEHPSLAGKPLTHKTKLRHKRARRVKTSFGS